MKSDQSIAFVLGLSQTGLGAVRSLGRTGIPVIALDSDASREGFRSRYCEAKLCPDPVNQPNELLRFLLDEGQRLLKPGILFPTSDPFVLFLSRFRNELHHVFLFALPPEEVLEAIVNKRLQYEMAERVGVPYAATFYPEKIEDLEDLKNKIEYPAFIKPYYGHLWRKRFPNKGLKVIAFQELLDRFGEILPTGLQVMVQSVIPGPNTNHFKVSAYLSQNGDPLAIFTLRKIRQYPTEFGIGSLVESVHYPELVDLGLKFFKGIGYKGIGSIEFKRDERDGKLKMIELNPRLWQQNIQATVCGMNFPLIQYLDLTGQTPEPVTEFIDGLKWLDAMADFQAFWDYSRQGRLSFWKWMRSWKGTKVFSTFALDDLGPYLKATDFGLKYIRLPLYLLKQHEGEGAT